MTHREPITTKPAVLPISPMKAVHKFPTTGGISDGVGETEDQTPA